RRGLESWRRRREARPLHARPAAPRREVLSGDRPRRRAGSRGDPERRRDGEDARRDVHRLPADGGIDPARAGGEGAQGLREGGGGREGRRPRARPVRVPPGEEAVRRAALLLLIAFAPPLALAQSRTAGRLVVRATDGGTGAPLGGVAVRIESP